MKINEVIENLISIAVHDVYQIKDIKFVLEHPENEEFGDYATNVALKLSSMVKQPPIEIANKISYRMLEIVRDINDNDNIANIIDSVSVANPGFINIKLSLEWLQSVLYDIHSADKGYGSSAEGNTKVIALEHSNVNPNKAAHIGHLRNACIGQFIERVYELLGYDVKVQYYDNDLGVQVTTSLMGVEQLKELHPEDYDKYDHYAWDIYSKMETLISENPDLAKERADLMLRLENSSDEIALKQEELSNKILINQLLTFYNMDFDYDVIIRERDIINLKIWERAFELLKKNENVYFSEKGESKGCWLLRMKNTANEDSVLSGVEEDKILVRSNGVPTYTGKDIAYHMWKFGLLDNDFFYKKFTQTQQIKPLWITDSKEHSDTPREISFKGCDYVLNVIDVKQTYAMEAVKKSLEYLGYDKQSQNMKHINYGFVYVSKDTAKDLGIDVSDGKSFYGMSGRKGWGVKIDDLISLVDDKLIQDYGDFGYIKEVRNGAIKFQMLKSNTFQDLVFDLKDSLDIKGYTGTYLQYAYVRANSILTKLRNDSNYDIDEKFSLVSKKTNLDVDTKEAHILRFLYRYPEVICKAGYEFAPNILCEYLFELSKRFNSFYNDLPILAETDDEKKALRICITESFKIVVKNGLYILGISVPEKM